MHAHNHSAQSRRSQECNRVMAELGLVGIFLGARTRAVWLASRLERVQLGMDKAQIYERRGKSASR